jgi:hypothetical protein
VPCSRLSHRGDDEYVVSARKLVEVQRRVHNCDAFSACREIHQQVASAIGRAVVNCDDLEVDKRLLLQGKQRFPEESARVLTGNQNGKARRS